MSKSLHPTKAHSLLDSLYIFSYSFFTSFPFHSKLPEWIIFTCCLRLLNSHLLSPQQCGSALRWKSPWLGSSHESRGSVAVHSACTLLSWCFLLPLVVPSQSPLSSAKPLNISIPLHPICFLPCSHWLVRALSRFPFYMMPLQSLSPE